MARCDRIVRRAAWQEQRPGRRQQRLNRRARAAGAKAPSGGSADFATWMRAKGYRKPLVTAGPGAPRRRRDIGEDRLAPGAPDPSLAVLALGMSKLRGRARRRQAP